MRRTEAGKRLAAVLGLLLLLVSIPGCSRRKPGSGVPSPRLAPDGEPPDVVLITLDTVRADAVGFSGNRNVETPNMDRLAAEGLVFGRAHASNVVTLPAHVNMLTGRYPYEHGVRDNSGFRLDASIPTLATLLSERGYTAGAFVGAFPLDSRYGLDRGFSVYDDNYPPGASPEEFEMRERPAEEVIAAARTWYGKEQGRKRFLWVHLYDPHAPYRPPAPLVERYRNDPYLGEIAAVDAALEPLLSDIRRSGSGRTLLFLTSDHGEALGDHGEKTHGLFAYEATLKVPFVLWYPGRVSPGRLSPPVRHVDILPTALEAVGAPIPAGLLGKSLLASENAKGTYFEALSASLNRGWAPLRGVLEGDYKFIDLPIPELYDLRNDPEEKRNLVSERLDLVRRLKARLPPITNSRRAAAPSAEEARRLLSLGYLSGSARQKSSYTEEDDPKRLVGLDAKLHRVIEQYQAGDLPGATQLARWILRERPSMAVGYEFLSFLLEQGGRGREAADVLRDAVRRELASEVMKVRLALILSESGSAEEALAVLAPLAQSRDPDPQNATGIALADAGRIPESVAVFEKLVAADPGDALAFQNMGIALLKGGDARAALSRFEQALQINRKLPRALNARGVAQAELGDSAGAVVSWQEAVKLDSKQFDALFNIGVVAGRRGEWEVARAALRRFVATAPPALYGKDLTAARRMLQQLGGA